jgi:hypothetical protein
MKILSTSPWLDTPILNTEEPSLLRHPMSDEEWQEATAALSAGMARLDQERIQVLALQVREALARLDRIMTRYCGITCPLCPDPCCQASGIFYNQTDVLALAALKINHPPGQTRTLPGAPCRYLTATGCCLERIARPYVCVWYLCEAQTGLLWEESPGFQRRFMHALECIRASRLRLQALFETSLPLPPQVYLDSIQE